MKTIESIIEEIQGTGDYYLWNYKQAILNSAEEILAFYNKYPSLNYLTAGEVFTIHKALNKPGRSVRVYALRDGGVAFAGQVVDMKSVPLVIHGGELIASGKHKNFDEECLACGELTMTLRYED